MSLLSAPVFAISGSPRVGKTSLGEEVSRRLGFSFTSFGDYVRSIAKASSSGAAPYRRALQDLGQRLVKEDPRGFCGAVLARCRGDISEPLVIDGLRHLQLEPVLRELLPTRDLRLIYVESRPSARLVRWGGHASEEEVALVDAHPVEKDLALLRKQSDLIIDTTEGFEPALAHLLEWITDAYPSLARRNPVGVATGSKS